MYKYLLLFAITGLLTAKAPAQTPILNTPVIIECHDQPLGRVLDKIAGAGKFYFSYAGNLFNKDSLVTLPRETKPVGQILQQLFGDKLQYREEGHYLILLPAAKTAQEEDHRYIINGTILDERTGEALADVSVYDPGALAATMSRKDGSFTVRIKNKDWPIILAVSKESYIDTLIQIQPHSGHDLTITISPDAFPPKALPFSPQETNDSITIVWQGDSIDASGRKNLVPGVETTGFARLVLSYRLRVQTVNLKKWFVTRPVQLSLIPGLSTNGRLNSQVTNKVSLNLAGGYEAGLKGIGLAGAFNIDKKSVAGIQAAGAINIVGGPVTGIQLAGVVNKDLDSVRGFQAAGLINIAKEIKGVQLSVINHADSVKGLQYGILNHTHDLKGLQVGLINFVDTSEGVSLGLINIVKHGGLHELSFYADEISPVNAALRLGTRKFYGIIYAGMNPNEQHRSYYYGYGYGMQFPLARQLAIRPEVTVGQISALDLHHFDDGSTFLRFNLDLHWKPAKNFAVSLGPSINLYYRNKYYYVGNKLYQPVPYGYHTFALKDNTSLGWIGWRVAVNLF